MSDSSFSYETEDPNFVAIPAYDNVFCFKYYNFDTEKWYYDAEMTEEFSAALPEQFRDCIEPTYEIQIRTVFSEGWHEVEHDLRYKCKEDWEGCEPYSRALNGVIATLETAEWNMKSLFADMARLNFIHSNYTAMLRNKFHLKFKAETLSEALFGEKDADAGVLSEFPCVAQLFVFHNVCCNRFVLTNLM